MPDSKTIGILAALAALAAAALYMSQASASISDPAATPADGGTWLDWLGITTPGAGAADAINQVQNQSPIDSPASWFDNIFGPSLTPDQVMADTSNASPDQRLSALLAVIRRFESGNDYTKLYGGGHFSDFSHHPNIRVPFYNPATGKTDYSTAAGAYQINYPTYQDYAGRLGISSFTPADQDAIAVAILQSTGAVDSLAAGDTQTAIMQASQRWASLPGSTSGQHQQSMQTSLNAFDAALAVA